MSKEMLAYLPPATDLETKRILKRVNDANRERRIIWHIAIITIARLQRNA